MSFALYCFRGQKSKIDKWNIVGVVVLLQVWDEQGKTDTSRVSFSVVEDPAHRSAVDLLLDRELTRFTHTDLKVRAPFCRHFSL